MRDPHSNPLAVWAAPALAGAAGWVATQFLVFLDFLRFTLTLFVGAELAEFLARPYVFTGLCMVTAAAVTGAFKLAESYLSSSIRRERDEARAAVERLTGKAAVEVLKRV